MRELPAAPVIPLDIGGKPYAVGALDVQALPGAQDPEARAWAVLQQVLDPEVPALSVCDLGIVREVAYAGVPAIHAAPQSAPNVQARQPHIQSSTDIALDGELTVSLTPTYSGCPATEAIEAAVREALHTAGFAQVRTELRRAPAWTTDWITAEGRAKLKAYGIAPPAHLNAAPDGSVPIRIVRRADAETVACPRCESADTERLSAFGTTACKSLWRCRACREPFEHFKPI